MKSQRRREIKSNELADVLQDVKDFVARNGSKLLTVTLLVVLVAAAGLYFYRSRQISTYDGWQQFYAFGSQSTQVRTEDIQILAAQTNDENLASLAHKRFADTLTLQYLFAGNADKQRIADEAQRAYQAVVDCDSSDPARRGGAEMGLAIIAENLGQWDTAKAKYDKIIADTSLNGTGVKVFARARVEQLDQWRQLAGNLVTTAPATMSADDSET